MSQGGSGTYVKGIDSEDIADSIGIYLSARTEPISHAKLMEVRRVLEVQIAPMGPYIELVLGPKGKTEKVFFWE